VNERIKQLAEQAGFRLHLDGEFYTANHKHLPITEDIEKFAELIVAECMEVCRRGKYDGRDDMSLIQFNNGIRFCMNAIDNHFGD
jgi:hypothetical protein